MTINDLAKKLCVMYKNAAYSEKSLMIRLFGIHFASEIRAAKITPLEIIKYANNRYDASLTEHYQTEINKGIKLSKYVVLRNDIKI